MLSYVAMHSKQHKTTKVIKLQWLASIWCQNIENNPKLQKWSITMNLHLFDVKSIKNVELRLNAFKTTQNYKSNQITMTCIDLMSKHSKLQKWSKYKDLHRFHVKPIKTTQNYKSDQITMYCIDLTSKRSKRFVAKHSKKLNYKSNQITTICIDLTSKRSKMLSYVAKHSKQRKTTKVIKIHITCIDLTSKRSKMSR